MTRFALHTGNGFLTIQSESTMCFCDALLTMVFPALVNRICQRSFSTAIMCKQGSSQPYQASYFCRHMRTLYLSHLQKKTKKQKTKKKNSI